LRRRLIALAALVVVADQITKVWMNAALADGHVVTVAPGLAWELTHNDGAAFGVMEGGNLLLIVAATVAVVMLLLWAKQVRSGAMAAALGLLLGGAVGNLVDRVRLGHVVDFIALRSGGRTIFPNFNVADSAITIGACLLAYTWYRAEQAALPERSPTLSYVPDAGFAAEAVPPRTFAPEPDPARRRSPSVETALRDEAACKAASADGGDAPRRSEESTEGNA
jgi:signal peptidase II